MNDVLDPTTLTFVCTLYGPKPDTGYVIRIKTSGKLWSGTNDDIEIKLIGPDGDSGWLKLNDEGRDVFERNQQDEFYLETPFVGQGLKRVSLRNPTDRDAWWCDWVKVTINDKTKFFQFGTAKITKSGVMKTPNDPE